MPAGQRTPRRRTPTQKKARPGRPPRFTRAEVLDAALRVIDEHDLPALSIRRVADELGIGVMTVYGYVRTKEELVDAVTERALSALTAETHTGPPAERIKSAIRALHHTLREHTGVLEILLNAKAPGPALDPVREDLLAMLSEIGLDKSNAMDALSILYSYAIGFAVTERARNRESPQEELQRLQNLPPRTYPHLANSAHEYATRLSDQAFETGLDSLVNDIH